MPIFDENGNGTLCSCVSLVSRFSRRFGIVVHDGKFCAVPCCTWVEAEKKSKNYKAGELKPVLETVTADNFKTKYLGEHLYEKMVELSLKAPFIKKFELQVRLLSNQASLTHQRACTCKLMALVGTASERPRTRERSAGKSSPRS